MTNYKTVSGDTWDLISFKLYGDYSQLDELINANPDHTDVFIFPSGIDLIIPDRAERFDQSVPPWKRGG